MFPPPPVWSPYSVLIRVRVRARTRVRVGVGVRVGDKVSVRVRSGENCPSGAFGVCGLPMGAHVGRFERPWTPEDGS